MDFFTKKEIMGVPRPGPGPGSRGIKLRPHAAIFPPRGPSAIDKRPSRPYGLRSPLKGTIATKQQSCKWLEA